MGMNIPKWKIFLAESDDLKHVADITQTVSGKNLQLALNRSGSFSCSLPLTHEFAGEFETIKRCIKAYRNDTLIWSGMLWGLNEDAASNRLNVNAVGWFEKLMKRFTDEELSYNDMNGGEIAFALLEHANDQDPTYITEGSNDATQDRSQSYDRDTNIGQSIIDLSNVENGFDMEIDPSTRELNIVQQKMEDRVNVRFGFNVGADNLQNVTRNIDAEQVANRILAVGRYGTAQADDSVSIAEYGLFTQISPLTDVADMSILAAFANAEVAVNSRPRHSISFTPLPVNVDHRTVPEPFVEYGLGDKVYVSADKGRMQFENQACRVFTMSVSIDEEGNERISQIQTTYSS